VKPNNHKASGLTAIEVIITIALLGILLTLGQGAYSVWQKKVYIHNAAEELKSVLVQTQQKAAASADGKSWGVHFEANRYVIFSGDIYDPLNPANSVKNLTGLNIVNPATIYFSASADQTEVTKLTASMSGTVTLDAFEKEPIMASIATIGFTPKTGETGTVYEVRLNLPLTANRLPLRLGMTGDIEFSLREIPNVLTVPAKYIKSESGKKYLMVKKGNSREKIYVITGVEMDGDTEIKEGIKENDIVY